MAELPPLRLAVVGHVNAGKTSLARTLLRTGGLGEVSAMPGSTAAAVDGRLALAGTVPLQVTDAPGFSDPVALHERFQQQSAHHAPAERLRALLGQAPLPDEPATDRAALQAALAADLLLLVVDARELVLPKHRATLALLRAAGRPIVALLNRAAAPDAHRADWHALLAEHGVADVLAVDAFAPAPDAAERWLAVVARLLGGRAPQAEALAPAWRAAQLQRAAQGRRVVAGALLGLAAMRHTLNREEVGDEARKAERLAAFRRAVAAAERQAQQALLVLHGFAASEQPLPPLADAQGRWSFDIGNAQVLKDGATKAAGGAALGAVIGAGVDVALLGLSLGAGAAVGAAVGTVASQGVAETGRKAYQFFTGQQDLTAEEGLLTLVADRLLGLERLLQARGHGALGPWQPLPPPALTRDTAQPLLDALAPARARPEWAPDRTTVDRTEHDRTAFDRQTGVVVAALDGVSPGA